METDVEQLSLPGGGGPYFRLHRAYHPQNNFNFLIVCSSSPVPRDMLETHQSSKGSSYRKKLHAVIMFLISTFGGYVQVEYQSKRKSPLDEHATIMAAIFMNLCLYALSFIAEYALPGEESYVPTIIKTFGPLFGFLVVVLLLMILSPLLGKIAFAIWGFFIVKAAIIWFSRMVQYLRRVISGIRRYFDVSQSSQSLEIV